MARRALKMLTSLAFAGGSPSVVPYHYSGCYFKLSSLAINGYDVSWPSLTLDHCAYACPQSQFFWLQSGIPLQRRDRWAELIG